MDRGVYQKQECLEGKIAQREGWPLPYILYDNKANKLKMRNRKDNELRVVLSLKDITCNK